MVGAGLGGGYRVKDVRGEEWGGREGIVQLGQESEVKGAGTVPGWGWYV